MVSKINLIYYVIYILVWRYVGQGVEDIKSIYSAQKIWEILLNPQKFLFLQMIFFSIYIHVNMKELNWIEMIIRKGKISFFTDYIIINVKYIFFSILINLVNYWINGNNLSLTGIDYIAKYIISILLFSGIYLFIYMISLSKPITLSSFISFTFVLDILWFIGLYYQIISNDINKGIEYNIIISFITVIIYLFDWMLLKRKELIN